MKGDFIEDDAVFLYPSRIYVSRYLPFFLTGFWRDLVNARE